MMEQFCEMIEVRYYDDDKFIGSATLYTNSKFLSNFEINEEYRGKGYGQKFLKHLIEKYDIRALDVLDSNEIAQHIYKKFDFIFTGEKLLNMVRVPDCTDFEYEEEEDEPTISGNKESDR